LALPAIAFAALLMPIAAPARGADAHANGSEEPVGRITQQIHQVLINATP
jgi:hypothetical protein